MQKAYGVSAANPLAFKAGMDVLQLGGNTVDAAVAIFFVLGVVEAYASGIGSGGNILVYPTDGVAPVVFDYRETAPEFTHPAYQIDVPGFVKGMEQHKKSLDNFLGRMCLY